ncbi:protein kinase [Roseiconus lacunae]|uniref:protein kinase domain-containing protein n=1 Tax=Roseiconus lacunae TaxID=2605694 RepID=UPI00308F9728|nr:protein kinase [Stieleria sp. HD01]
MTSPPPVEFQPGMEVVPGYTLISPLGSGMAGDVWQAQAAGGIKVALKVVRSLKDVGGRKELKALKTIRDVHHPNLCPLFGFWTKDGSGRILADGETEELTLDSVQSHPHPNGIDSANQPPPAPSDQPMQGTMAIDQSMADNFASPQEKGPSNDQQESPKPKVTAEQLIVVMGLGDCTLYDRLRFIRQDAGLSPDDVETPLGLEPEETIRYLRAAASAIDLLNHEHDVYHFDIKPQNILLVGGEAQVCDFGLAKKIEADVRATQQTHATPAYASPEILEGEHLSTVSGDKLFVDQYSLAVTYYELRTGLLPFDVTTHASMIVAKSTGRLDLSALSPPERKVLQKALERDPKKRFRSCTEMIKSLAVASGVDKSGGITLTRIIGTVAALLLCMTLGFTSWWYFFPESFNDWINQGQINTAKELLARTQSSFERTEDQAFNESSFTIINVVLGEAADLAAHAPDATTSGEEGDLRTSSQILFAKAANRLLERVHQSLSTVENEGDDLRASDMYTALAEGIAVFDPDVEPDSEQQRSVKKTILQGVSHWSDSDNQSLADSYEQFSISLSAAKTRFRLHENAPVDPKDLQAIRTAIENTPEVFEQVQGIDLAFASMLIPIASIDQRSYTSWDASQWLNADVRRDLGRAERLGGARVVTDPYLSLWLEIRDAFIQSVEPVATGAIANDRVSDQALDEVRRDFPSLESDRKLAQLRQAIIGNDWDTAAIVIEQLNTQTNLDQTRRQSLMLLSRMKELREQPTAMGELLLAIQSQQLSATELRTRKLLPVLENFVRYCNQERLAMAFDPASIPFDAQVETLQSLEQVTELSLDPAAFAVPLMAALISPSDRVIDQNGNLNASLKTCVERIEQSADYSLLRSALKLEQAIRADEFSAATVRDAASEIQQSNTSLLDILSPSYRPYLLLCAAGLERQSVDAADELLRRQSRQSIRQLGDWRLLSATELMADAAIDISSVRNDSFESRRYEPDDTNRTANALAASYLRSGKLLADHLESQTALTLEVELFIHAVATNTDPTNSVEVPGTLRALITSAELSSQRSIQLLLTMHRVGLKLVADENDSSRRATMATVFVLNPAIELIDRLGIEQFGPGESESLSKTSLVDSVILPTVRTIVLPNLDIDSDGLIVKGIRQISPGSDAIQRFSELAALVYTDRVARSGYDDKDQFCRDHIALTTLTLREESTEEEDKAKLIQLTANAFLALEQTNGAAFLRFADLAPKLGADTLTATVLRAEAYKQLAESTGDWALRHEEFGRSRQAFLRVLELLGNGIPELTINRRHRFNALCNVAAIGVRQAFYSSDVDVKLPILLKSFDCMNEAMAMNLDELTVQTEWNRATLWINKGNACEDIAFYCSAGDSEEEIERREKFFTLAIEAFGNAKELGKRDLKAQYSLGRALLRQSSFYDGEEREQILDRSNNAFEQPPTQEQLTTELPKAIEWYVWKMKVDEARLDTNDALASADLVTELLSRPEMIGDFRRGEFMWAACLVYGKQKQFEKMIAGLKSLGDSGTPDEFARHMGTLIDLIGRSSDRGLFTYILDTVKHRRPPDPGFDAANDGSYQMSKVSTQALQDMSERLAHGQKPQPSQPLFADLREGARALHRWVDPQSGGDYAKLGTLLAEGQQILMNRDEREAIRFAYELALIANESEEFPFYVKNRCYAIVMYSLMFWERVAMQENEGALTPQFLQTVVDRYKDDFSQERRETLTKCLRETAELAKAKDPALAKSMLDAVRMIDAFGVDTSADEP